MSCADNILIQRVPGGQSTNTNASAVSVAAPPVSVYDGSMDEGLGDESIDELDHVVYKIGDLGQVSGISGQSVDEGMCLF